MQKSGGRPVSCQLQVRYTKYVLAAQIESTTVAGAKCSQWNKFYQVSPSIHLIKVLLGANINYSHAPLLGRDDLLWCKALDL